MMNANLLPPIFLVPARPWMERVGQPALGSEVQVATGTPPASLPTFSLLWRHIRAEKKICYLNKED